MATAQIKMEQTPNGVSIHMRPPGARAEAVLDLTRDEAAQFVAAICQSAGLPTPWER